MIQNLFGYFLIIFLFFGSLLILCLRSNPLEMTIAELNEYFDKKDNEPGEQALKYSKYLYKLEKNHEITEKSGPPACSAR